MTEGIDQRPRMKKNIFSQAFFLYTIGIFKKGRKSLWNDTNLYQAQNAHRSEKLGEKLERLWLEHKENCESKKKTPNIIKPLLKMFWKDLLINCSFLIISILSRIVQPFLFGAFLSYFTPYSNLSKYEASWYISLFIVANGINSFFSAHFKASTCTTSMKIRAACTTLLQRKILKLSLAAIQDNSRGNALNIISNDLSRFDQTVHYAHYIWGTPMYIIGILHILYYDAGIPGLVGMLWYLIYIFLQSYSARLTGSYRNKIAVETDKRIKLMNEILSGIKVIKMCAWEEIFRKTIESARRSELGKIIKATYLRGILHSLLSFANVMALFFGILALIFTNESITAPRVFNLIVYYNSFNFVISLMFPLSIIKLTELNQVLKRVNDFMVGTEIVAHQYSGTTENVSIEFENVTANWTETWNHDKTYEISPLNSNGNIVLHNINLSLDNGKFLGVIGPVGSGKTSLLCTILGETFISGKVSVYGTVSYASQNPWIFPGTIKQNILFDQIFEDARYEEVLRVCDLKKDLDDFPEKDLTVVGERGASLSGGQKARLNLARAIYKNVDIYLFDDPFASVDVQVANFLMDECFNEFLKGKTRVMVTHHVQYLKNCDEILVLNSGRIDKAACQKFLKEDYINESLGKQIPEAQIIEKLEKSPKLSTKKIIAKEKQKNLLFNYLKTGNNLCVLFVSIICFVLVQVTTSSIFIFVSYWTGIEESRNSSVILTGIQKNMQRLKTFTYVYVFLALLGILLIISLFKAFIYTKMVMNSSKKIQVDLLYKIMGTPLSTFDQIDTGQILTRFAKDMGAVDEILPRTIMESFTIVLALILRIVIIVVLNPYMIIAVIVIYIILLSFIKIFVRTIRNIKRIEGHLMGQVLTQIIATIQGLPVIRCSKAQNRIIKEFDEYHDQYTSCCYMIYSVSHAFSFVIESLSYIFISLITISLFLLKDEFSLNGSEIGLAITQALTLTTYLQFGIVQCVQVDNNLVSIERILEYNELPQEPNVIPTEPIEENWPQNGRINFSNVQIQYNDYSPIVLKNLNFVIEAREKVGIVGRTGAGKSTLVSAILNLIPKTGIIQIDSLDINQIPLNILRSRIAVIPQDPFLFSGSLRYNLDPFKEYDDHVLQEALKEIEWEQTGSIINCLDDQIIEGGANLSVGQRQLLCLTRTIIRKNRIVILDEATSNMDSVTDNLIQKTARKHFSECTVLTIAHRLSTIMDSDRVMVIDSGEIVQFDRPEILLKDMNGKFFEMVNEKID